MARLIFCPAFSRPIGRYPQGEECGEAILRFDNGAIATLAASWVDLAEPSLLLSPEYGGGQISDGAAERVVQRAMRDSNPRPLAPEASALSS